MMPGIIGIIYHSADETAIFTLAAALKDLGCETRDYSASAPPSACIVALSNHFISSSALRESEKAARDSGALIFPILLPDTDLKGYDFEYPISFLRFFEDESSISKTAERIKLLLDIGASDLTAWNALRAKALSRGNPDSYFTRSEMSAAGYFLRKPVSELPEANKDAVSEMLLLSEKRFRRIRGRLAAASMAFFLALIASGAAAIWRKGVADAERLRAVASANEYESERLADDAFALMRTDPDAPWLLAQRANEISPTDDSSAASRAVLEILIPHKSYALPVPGASVAALRSKLVAVGLQYDGGLAAIRKRGCLVHGFRGA
ncbi:MAG: hypothetical protein LBU32_16035 [Clostridiales bacterium]|jgi:hypothetical protein|nr:hypothetical protein [Clostridiales bacterium]